jgi:lysophospholipase L1-like esterase
VTPKRALAVVGATGAALALLLLGQVVLARGRTYLVNVDFTIDRTIGPDLGSADPFELRVLGDSTAAGVGTTAVADALPVLVAERVAERIGRQVHVVGHGVSGARTADVRGEQLARLDDDTDAVVIVVGSNDVVHLTPTPRLQDQTRDLLEAAQGTGAPVVLGGIPRFAGVGALARPLRDVTDRFAGIQREAQRRAAAQVEGAVFVDIAALASPRFAGRPEAFSSDAFHPSAVGYGFWADALAPAVVSATKAQGEGERQRAGGWGVVGEGERRLGSGSAAASRCGCTLRVVGRRLSLWCK